MMQTPSAPLASVRPRTRLVVSIEGNIGIGKSTLLANLRKHYAGDTRVAFVDEPVGLWEEHGLLAAMYSNSISRCAFQLMAVTTRYTALLRALESGASLIITERSLHSDRHCFASVNLQAAADISAYAVTHEALVNSLPDDISLGTVMLQVPRAVLHQRIAKRARAAEADAANDSGGIPDAYLERLDNAHARYYEMCEEGAKHAVDATAPPAQVAAAVIDAIEALDASKSPSSPLSVMDSMQLA